MAFQLLGAILIGTFIGKWIDGKMNNSQPYAAAIGALIGIMAGLYSSLKDFFNKDSSKNK
jgi:F0F1-type ATP synthase assembly protein I